MKLKYNLMRATATPRHLLSVIRHKLFRSSQPPKRVIIFGEGRCGSTALVSRLNSMDGVQCDNEILAFKVPFPYAHVLACSSASKKEVYGCKILAFHIRDLQPISDRDGFLMRLHKDGFKIIHLRRENLIHHAMSNIRAQQFGYHQQKAKRKKKTGKVDVDLDVLMAWMMRTEELYEYEDVLLRDVPHLSLTYEGSIADDEKQRRTAREVCEFLGLPPNEGQCAYQKISPRSLSDSISNYEEIANSLKGTRYAKFLDPQSEPELVG